MSKIPGTTRRASLSVRITDKNGDRAEAGKIWENQFYTGKMDQQTPKKRPKVGGHMPRSHGNWLEFFSVHYSRRRSHFSAGVVQIVLKRDYNDFSRSAFWYFSLLHFHNYSPTTFYRVQHTAAEAIMLHSSLISVSLASLACPPQDCMYMVGTHQDCPPQLWHFYSTCWPILW